MNKFLLGRDKFMPEMHLNQPGVNYSACGLFTKNKEWIEKFMQTGNTNFIYKNELDKACLQHDMAHGKSFRENIWDVDVVDMQWLRKYNKGNKYLLCSIDLFSKYAWVVPIKNKKRVSIVNEFSKIISEGRKPNKIWFNQGSEFYNNSF